MPNSSEIRWEDARSTNGPERARDPLRTQRLILRSASVLFAKHGPDVATVDQIARHAGYSKRMVYHYFGNKKNLYQAVIKRVYGRIKQVALEVLGESVGLNEVIDRLIQEYFLFLQQNPEFVALLNWENSHEVQGLKQVDMDSFIQPVCEVVKEAIEREQKKPADDMQVKYVIMTCMALCGYYFSNQKSMCVVFKLDLSDPAHQQRWLDHIRSLVVQGISGCYRDPTDSQLHQPVSIS